MKPISLGGSFQFYPCLADKEIEAYIHTVTSLLSIWDSNSGAAPKPVALTPVLWHFQVCKGAQRSLDDDTAV